VKAETSRPRVGVRCDAGPRTGVGHLVRCIALAEELRGRGVDVLFLGDTGGLPWVEQQLDSRGLPLRPAPAEPAAFAELVRTARLGAVVLDGYHLASDTGATLRACGVRVLALVDGAYGAEQDADLYLDQNLGAADRQPSWPTGARVLAGVEYALLRDLVRCRRPAEPPTARESGTPEVLAVFGGTDPFRAALVIAPLLLATRRPLALTVVADAADVVGELRRLALDTGQRMTVRPPVEDLPALVTGADLVISAAGSSVWELCCLGAATGVVCVADNQEVGYRSVVAERLAAPVGRLAELTGDAVGRRAALDVLTELLTDPGARLALAGQGWRHVDGRGRERVADALLSTRSLPQVG
jgi:spore coat polysaccharide biosynthesis predicted glycosyltransferase SpsG